MLDTRRSVHGLALPGEWWKDRAATAADPARVFVWKRGFPPGDLAALEGICQEGLDRCGYERTARTTTTHDVYALDARTVEAGEEFLRRAAAAGVRYLPLRYESIFVSGRSAEWPGPLVFLGDSVPARRPAQRWADLNRLARTLMLRRLRGKKNLRVPDLPPSSGRSDAVARIARLLLLCAARPMRLSETRP